MKNFKDSKQLKDFNKYFEKIFSKDKACRDVFCNIKEIGKLLTNISVISKDTEVAYSYADASIESTNMLCVLLISDYALDPAQSPYDLPEQKKKVLTRHLSKMLINKNTPQDIKDMFLCMFLASYGLSILNAVKHREEALKHKQRKTLGRPKESKGRNY